MQFRADTFNAFNHAQFLNPDSNMADTNFEYLYELDPINAGTPTVYDLKRDKTLDIYDNNWLSKLMSS